MGKSVVILILLAGVAAQEPGRIPLTTKSEEARALFLSGQRKSDRFHSGDARKDLLKAVELDPEFAMAWLQLSFVSESMEQFEKSHARAMELKGNASEAEALIILATDHEHQGRLDEARKLRLEVVERYPGDARARYFLGMSYWMTESEDAVTHLQKAVEIDPTLDVAWNILGYANHSLGRIEEAIAAHRQYVKLLPEEPNAHDSLAESLLKAGRYQESISEYRKAVALDPSFSWSRCGIGHNLVFLGEYAEARRAYGDAIDRARTPQEKYQFADWRTVCEVYAGDLEAALAAAWKTAALARTVGSREEATSMRNVARVELLAGSHAAAEATARHALDLLPEDTDQSTRKDLERSVLRLRIETQVLRGDLLGARKLLEKLRAATSMDNPWQAQLYRFTEGFTLLKAGDAAAAELALQGAGKSDPRALYWLARSMAAQGKKDPAREIFTRVTEWNSPSLSHAMVLAKARLALDR